MQKKASFFVYLACMFLTGAWHEKQSLEKWGILVGWMVDFVGVV